MLDDLSRLLLDQLGEDPPDRAEAHEVFGLARTVPGVTGALMARIENSARRLADAVALRMGPDIDPRIPVLIASMAMAAVRTGKENWSRSTDGGDSPVPHVERAVALLRTVLARAENPTPMSRSTRTPPEAAALPQRFGLVFAALMTTMLLAALDETIVSTALPTIVGELDGVRYMARVTTAYVLAATIAMPVYGRLPDMAWLIAGRAVQGLGGRLTITTQAIVADLVPPRQRAKYMAPGRGGPRGRRGPGRLAHRGLGVGGPTAARRHPRGRCGSRSVSTRSPRSRRSPWSWWGSAGQ